MLEKKAEGRLLCSSQNQKNLIGHTFLGSDLRVYEFLKRAVYQYELGPVEQRRVFESFGKCLPTFQELTEFFVVVKIRLFLDWKSMQLIELYFLLMKHIFSFL